MNILDEGCSICLELFTDPVILPCKHIFCRQCVTEALDLKQSCPICRRLMCNMIDTPHLSLGEKNPETQGVQGLPVFTYEIAIALNNKCQFNFFEKRYVAMVTEALQNDLTFIIDPGYQNYCIKVKLIECVPIPEHGVYLCSVICVERLKIVETSFRIIEGTKLQYVTTQPLQDQGSEECIQLYKQLIDVINDLNTLVQINENENNQLFPTDDIEIVSKESLSLLGSIRISEKSYLNLFYSLDLQKRVQVILNHYSFILNYYKK